MAKTKLTQEVIDLFWLLQNAQRLRIAELLGRGIASRTDELAELVGINQSSVTIALQKFRSFQFLTDVKKEGLRIYVALDKERIAHALWAFADAVDIDLSKRPVIDEKPKLIKTRKSAGKKK